MSVSLSFIVPAHDEERLIAGTLRAIAAAARPLGLAFAAGPLRSRVPGDQGPAGIHERRPDPDVDSEEEEA